MILIFVRSRGFSAIEAYSLGALLDNFGFDISIEKECNVGYRADDGSRNMIYSEDKEFSLVADTIVDGLEDATILIHEFGCKVSGFEVNLDSVDIHAPLLDNVLSGARQVDVIGRGLNHKGINVKRTYNFRLERKS